MKKLRTISLRLTDNEFILVENFRQRFKIKNISQAVRVLIYQVPLLTKDQENENCETIYND